MQKIKIFFLYITKIIFQTISIKKFSIKMHYTKNIPKRYTLVFSDPIMLHIISEHYYKTTNISHLYYGHDTN